MQPLISNSDLNMKIFFHFQLNTIHCTLYYAACQEHEFFLTILAQWFSQIYSQSLSLSLSLPLSLPPTSLSHLSWHWWHPLAPVDPSPGSSWLSSASRYGEEEQPPLPSLWIPQSSSSYDAELHHTHSSTMCEWILCYTNIYWSMKMGGTARIHSN